MLWEAAVRGRGRYGDESIRAAFTIPQPQRLGDGTGEQFTTAKLNDSHVRLCGFNESFTRWTMVFHALLIPEAKP